MDELLGNNGRKRHAARLSQSNVGERKYTWNQYVNWGQALLTQGCVKTSPVGTGPSPELARQYRCVHCHNLVREDLSLVKQDPETRERILRNSAPKESEKRYGETCQITPGTTLWGAVNRESFYNGYYAKYHKLTAPGGRPMNPRELADAIQICCRYCSCGRFADSWEVDSIIAYLWELELKLEDLDLPRASKQKVLRDLNGNDPEAITRARGLLHGRFLRRADADRANLPIRSIQDVDYYKDGAKVKGDARSGKLLYRSACAGCHQSGGIHAEHGASLANNLKRFHRLIRHGTERDELYMPLFTKQRLSRRQMADIRVYLQSLE